MVKLAWCHAAEIGRPTEGSTMTTPPSSPAARPRVLVTGASIAGPALAWGLAKSGFDVVLLERSAEADTRLENLEEFIAASEEFIVARELEGIPATLESFLDAVSLVADTDELDPEAAGVTLMTLHSAKGLEFPVVFLTGLEEGVFPHSRSMGDREELEEAVRRRHAECAVQFAGVAHLLDDVAAADQVPADVQLRDRRPLAVGLDPLADLGVRQHVDVRVVDAERIQRADGFRRKTALRRIWTALHEQHDAVGVEQGFDPGTQGGVERHGTRPKQGECSFYAHSSAPQVIARGVG